MIIPYTAGKIINTSEIEKYIQQCYFKNDSVLSSASPFYSVHREIPKDIFSNHNFIAMIIL